MPTARDIDEHRGRMPSKSLYWHTFGSLANALREAGFDVPVGEERLERALEQGSARADARAAAEVRRLGGGAQARTTTLLTEWQVYRMFDARRGAWSTFQFLVRERLVAAGTDVGRDGRLELARLERGERGEALEAERALLRRAHGRQRSLLEVRGRAGSEASSTHARRPRRPTSVPSATSRLRSFRPQVALDDLERGLGRGEEELVAARRRSRAAGRRRGRGRACPGARSSSQAVAIEPRSCSRAPGAPSVRLGEREDRLGVDRHLAARHARSRAASSSSSSLKMIPLWMPTTAPWRIGWLLAAIAGGPSCSRARGSAPRSRSAGSATCSSSALAPERCLCTVDLARAGAR